MSTTTLISVEEYLATSYDPDVDYVDGEIVERNVGERYHSETQAELILLLAIWRKQLPLRIFPEQRVQIRRDRFRVPDICVVLGRHNPPAIFIDPPFLCIEILSRDDRFAGLREKVDDYVDLGVPHIWLVDPGKREGWYCRRGEMILAQAGILRTAEPEIMIDLNELYREIDS